MGRVVERRVKRKPVSDKGVTPKRTKTANAEQATTSRFAVDCVGCGRPKEFNAAPKEVRDILRTYRPGNEFAYLKADDLGGGWSEKRVNRVLGIARHPFCSKCTKWRREDRRGEHEPTRRATRRRFNSQYTVRVVMHWQRHRAEDARRLFDNLKDCQVPGLLGLLKRRNAVLDRQLRKAIEQLNRISRQECPECGKVPSRKRQDAMLHPDCRRPFKRRHDGWKQAEASFLDRLEKLLPAIPRENTVAYLFTLPPGLLK